MSAEPNGIISQEACVVWNTVRVYTSIVEEISCDLGAREESGVSASWDVQDTHRDGHTHSVPSTLKEVHL